METALKHLACALLLSLLPTIAAAAAWQGDQQAGALRFTATQAGAKFTGHFGEFKVRFDFDPANPAKGVLDVTIMTASADSSDSERDELMHGRDFFWAEHFPEATYHAEGFKRDGKAWVASGKLTLRGVTQPVTVRFEAKPKLKQLSMQGGATLHRLEFGVGQGDWKETTWLADPVDVAFDLSLPQGTATASP